MSTITPPQKNHLTQGPRSAPTTSEVDGNSPSAPCPPRRSNNDIANACAAQQESAVLHLLNQARLATSLISRGSDRALALASCLKKSCASSDHRPPVSHANITSLARPCSPVSSGYLSSFRRRACSRAAPSVVAHCILGPPSALTGLTNVVSGANSAPWNSGKPSATTSRRRLST